MNPLTSYVLVVHIMRACLHIPSAYSCGVRCIKDPPRRGVTGDLFVTHLVSRNPLTEVVVLACNHRFAAGVLDRVVAGHVVHLFTMLRIVRRVRGSGLGPLVLGCTRGVRVGSCRGRVLGSVRVGRRRRVSCGRVTRIGRRGTAGRSRSVRCRSSRGYRRVRSRDGSVPLLAGTSSPCRARTMEIAYPPTDHKVRCTPCSVVSTRGRVAQDQPGRADRCATTDHPAPRRLAPDSSPRVYVMSRL